MTFTESPENKYQHKPSRKRLSLDQVKLLESSFNHAKKLNPEKKIQLAHYLGLEPRQVAVWYQNKRARWKTQSLGNDYQALQLRLNSISAEKQSLEREVKRLRRDLERAQEMLQLNCSSLTPFSPCDEERNSNLQSDRNCPKENTSMLQVEELYAYLMGIEYQLN